MWITIDPVDRAEDAAGSSDAAVFDDGRMAAEADKLGSRLKVDAAVTVAAATVVSCRNERLVFFATVLSFPYEVVFTCGWQ